MFFRINPRLLEGDTCKGQAQRLLERPYPEAEEAVEVAHVDVITDEVQVVRGAAAAVPWVST